MKKHNIYQKTKHAFNSLHLTDKCLLIFMLILIYQSTHNLFLNEIPLQDGNTVDIIVRTTAAAIFGYFISSNFQNGGNVTSEEINISEDVKEEKQQLHTAIDDPSCKNKVSCRNKLQIIVVAFIGIFALVMLVISRNYIATSSAAVATVSQLRDFISGSVGFLIGHSTHSDHSDKK